MENHFEKLIICNASANTQQDEYEICPPSSLMIKQDTYEACPPASVRVKI
jgi:hypothetical protein